MPACRAVRRAPVLGAALLIAAAAAVPPALAAAATTPAARTVTLSGTGVLDDVAASSARNVWAVGHYGPLGKPKALIEHWNGTGWSRVPVSPAGGWLDGITAVSARDLWAVGIAADEPLVVHFDGKAWRRVAIPAVPGPQRVLNGVSAVSADDIWAVGSTGNKTLTEHWNGTTWRQVPSPSPGPHPALEAVAAISAGDVWATGTTGRGTLILHWNGTAWQRTPSLPGGHAAQLVAVSGTSASNVWAVGATGGFTALAASPASIASAAREGVAVTASSIGLPVRPAAGSTSHFKPLLLHWSGTAWQPARFPEPASGGTFLGVFATSGRSAWAVGCTRFFGAPKARPLVLRWNGTAWNAERRPTGR